MRFAVAASFVTLAGASAGCAALSGLSDYRECAGDCLDAAAGPIDATRVEDPIRRGEPGRGPRGARRRCVRGRRRRGPAGGRRHRRRLAASRHGVGRAAATSRGEHRGSRRGERGGSASGIRCDLRTQGDDREVQRKPDLLREPRCADERLRVDLRVERLLVLHDRVRLSIVDAALLRARDPHARHQERPGSDVRRDGLLGLMRVDLQRLASGERLHLQRHGASLHSRRGLQVRHRQSARRRVRQPVLELQRGARVLVHERDGGKRGRGRPPTLSASASRPKPSLLAGPVDPAATA